jgi:hypothetical protein
VNKLKRIFKRLGVDIIGYLLIVLGLSIGWVPGPGGIPLILAGLTLLSIHNHWARQIIEALKSRGNDLTKLFFPNNPKIQLFHDYLLVITLFAVSYLVIAQPSRYWWIMALVIGGYTFSSLIFNRSRFKLLTQKK